MVSFNELLEKLNDELKNLATAIRAKTGKEDNLDLEEMAAEQDDVFDAGKKAEYDAFWDVAQNNGSMNKYEYFFAGRAWKDGNLKPKYNIVATGDANHMFASNSALIDLAEALESAGITMDLSNATRADHMFYYCTKLERVPAISVTGVTYSLGINNMFASCPLLHTIERLIIPTDRGLTANNSAFQGCKALVNIIIEGVIGANGWTFSSCPLSKASITSVINALSATTTGLTVTLKKTAVEAAFGSTTAAEWTALVATKPNWTISLA